MKRVKSLVLVIALMGFDLVPVEALGAGKSSILSGAGSKLAEFAAPKVACRSLSKVGRNAASLGALSKVEGLAHLGEDGVAALARHGQLAEPILKAAGFPGSRALVVLNGQNARRLAMLVEDGTLRQMGLTDKVLETVARYGDRAMEFVWQNKGALLVSAALVAFLADPEPFLNGARDFAGVVSQAVVAPLTAGTREAVRQVDWTIISGIALGMVVFAIAFRRCRKATCGGAAI